MAWLPSEIDRITTLTSEPVNCLNTSKSLEHQAQIRAGELVFKSPALLGGQAAKANMSCSSCHRNGRGNKNFSFHGVSAEPGTADVTSGIFSKQRADNIFNPVPIPDLNTPAGEAKVKRHDTNALTTFVHGQIEEEFNGIKPAAAVMSALIHYLQALETNNCDTTAYQAIKWQSDWSAAHDAAQLSYQSLQNNDPDSARFYTRTARASLQRLYQRYLDIEIRAQLIDLSRELESNLNNPAAKTIWPSDTPYLALLLRKNSSQSMYNPETLRRLLSADELEQ